jgi:hypothetical protein
MILEAQRPLVSIKLSKIHAGQIDIEICPTNVCYLFESHKPVTLQSLADYVYLYALYVGEYVDFSIAALTPSGDHPLDSFIADGLKNGYGDKVAEYYKDVPGCSASGDRRKCISALQKKLSIKRFEVRYDEGARTVTPAED